MPPIFIFFRSALTWIVLAILAAILGEFAVDFLRSHGFFEDPIWFVVAPMNTIAAIRNLPGFWTVLIAGCALLIGMWLDTFARATYRRTPKVSAWITPREALKRWGDPHLMNLEVDASKKYEEFIAEKNQIDGKVSADLETKLEELLYIKFHHHNDVMSDIKDKLYMMKIPTKGKQLKPNGKLGREKKLPDYWESWAFDESDPNLQSVYLGAIFVFREVLVGVPLESDQKLRVLPNLRLQSPGRPDRPKEMSPQKPLA